MVVRGKSNNVPVLSKLAEIRLRFFFGLMNFENPSQANRINGVNKHDWLYLVDQNVLSTFQKMWHKVSNVKSQSSIRKKQND